MALPDPSTRLISEPERCARSEAHALLLGSLLVSAPLAIAFLDRQLRFLGVNDALAAITGVPSAAHRGRLVQEVVPHLSAQVLADLSHVLASGATIRDAEITERVTSPAHPQRHWLASYYPVWDRAGGISAVGIVVVDITKRKHLEAQLLHAQKVTAIGQLAGGIAHDFTNLLTAMAGYVMLALAAIAPEASAHADLCELQRCTERAAELTDQLLAVMRSRREVAAVIDPNQTIRSMARLLGRLLGEDIVLDLRLATQDAAMRIEPGQLEQIILNLAVNAHDAMPGGGRLTIETVVLDLDSCSAGGQWEAQAASYVRLSISDSGAGMDQETQQRVFEPFFTTKPPGKGSGLGLVICSSIVEQHGGTIAVQSEPGRGTTVIVSFPRVTDQPDTQLHAASGALTPCGTETILVVEDDDTVRDLIVRSLRAQGYTVQSAADGAEALHHARACVPAWMDLLLTDVVMPGMSGPALAAELATIYPDIRILYISGYSDHVNVRTVRSDSQAAFLAKPFSVTELGWKVRELLDARVRPERQEG